MNASNDGANTLTVRVTEMAATAGDPKQGVPIGVRFFLEGGNIGIGAVRTRSLGSGWTLEPYNRATCDRFGTKNGTGYQLKELVEKVAETLRAEQRRTVDVAPWSREFEVDVRAITEHNGVPTCPGWFME